MHISVTRNGAAYLDLTAVQHDVTGFEAAAWETSLAHFTDFTFANEHEYLAGLSRLLADVGTAAHHAVARHESRHAAK